MDVTFALRLQLRSYGLLHGFDGVVWLVVLLNGCGGLLVAATMKYADNIVKCFAAALAILTGTILSVPIFGFELQPRFTLGVALTIAASILYSWAPEKPRVCGGAPEYELVQQEAPESVLLTPTQSEDRAARHKL